MPCTELVEAGRKGRRKWKEWIRSGVLRLLSRCVLALAWFAPARRKKAEEISPFKYPLH